MAAGANVKAVQRMLGHASAAMTLDVYAGLFEDELDAVADRMDEAARAAADSLRTGTDTVRPLRVHHSRSPVVGRPGIEPGTRGLKVRCSAS